MPTLPPMLHASREMLGIISTLREKGRQHAPAAHTRRSPAMAGFTRMAGKERPDAAYSPGAGPNPTLILVANYYTNIKRSLN